MSEQVEKLVAKIADEIARLWLERIPQLATLDEVEEQERILARELITLVGQAYADGMPLPGEEGRIFLREGAYIAHDRFASSRWTVKEPTLLIALSPTGIPAERKVGAGREEEE